jgi:hypothetical protein
VTEADRPNETRAAGFDRPNAGVSPRSIRKRGFHRALKRGETWAVLREQYNLMMRRLEESIVRSWTPALEASTLEDQFLSMKEVLMRDSLIKLPPDESEFIPIRYQEFPTKETLND